MAASLKNACMAVCLLCLAGTVQAAEQLSDPTRPFFELVPGLSADVSAGDAFEKTAPPPAGLQSVILSPRREAAIINGIEVERGQKVGDAELVVVNETCVVLMGPQGRQVLHMFPTVSLSKNELACIKRGMQPVSKAQASAVKAIKAHNTGTKKKPRAKKPVVCAPEEIKDGSKQ